MNLNLAPSFGSSTLHTTLPLNKLISRLKEIVHKALNYKMEIRTNQLLTKHFQHIFRLRKKEGNKF